MSRLMSQSDVYRCNDILQVLDDGICASWQREPGQCRRSLPQDANIRFRTVRRVVHFERRRQHSHTIRVKCLLEVADSVSGAGCQAGTSYTLNLLDWSVGYVQVEQYGLCQPQLGYCDNERGCQGSSCFPLWRVVAATNSDGKGYGYAVRPVPDCCHCCADGPRVLDVQANIGPQVRAGHDHIRGPPEVTTMGKEDRQRWSSRDAVSVEVWMAFILVGPETDRAI